MGPLNKISAARAVKVCSHELSVSKQRHMQPLPPKVKDSHGPLVQGYRAAVEHASVNRARFMFCHI